MTAPPDQPVALHCECAQRGMTGGKAHPLCPVHGHLHDAPQTCFELDGARVHGDPNMSTEARDALRAVIDASRQLLSPRGHEWTEVSAFAGRFCARCGVDEDDQDDPCLDCGSPEAAHAVD